MNLRPLVRVSGLILLILGLGWSAGAETVTLAWDQDPTGAVSGYIVAYGTEPGSHPTQIDIGGQVTYDVTGLASGTTYYFVVRAYDSAYDSSGDSDEVSATTSGGSNLPPSQPSNPIPADGSSAVSISTSIAWAASTNATGYDVAFGTSSSPPVVSTNQPDTAYQPLPLAFSTTYYWIVVANGPGGSTTSPVWSFKTADLTPPPDVPSDPNPTDGATNLPTTTGLSWAASSNALLYDVFFGTTNPPALVSPDQVVTSYQPASTLQVNTKYYWKIVAKGVGGTTEGPIWNFKTAAGIPPPGVPSGPNPANGATGVPTTAGLSWAVSSNTTQYDVLFGTTNPPSLVLAGQIGTSYQPATLASNTSYYWEIIANGPGGTTVGPIWHFTTQPATNTTGSADFVGTDTATQGNWQGSYGSDGYAIATDGTSLPDYADLTQLGQLTKKWAGSTSDVRALQKAGGTGRVAAAWYGNSYTFDLNLNDGESHQVAMYVLDWNSNARIETIEFLDTSVGTVLNKQTVTAFHQGQYWIWNVSGELTIRVTRIAGTDAVVSAFFFDPTGAVGNLPPTVALTSPTDGASFTEPATISLAATASAIDATITSVDFYAGSTLIGTVTTPPFTAPWSDVPAGAYTLTAIATDDLGVSTTSTPVQVSVAGGQQSAASATFVGRDLTTRGTWTGNYGNDGYSLANDTTSLPSYVDVTQEDGLSSWTWASFTNEVRALQKASGNGRLAAAWYGDSFTFDVNFVDGDQHQIALYVVDWDSFGRHQTIELLDAADGTLLDVQTVKAFHGGQYLVWQASGAIQIRVTSTQGNYAVISGLFFDGVVR